MPVIVLISHPRGVFHHVVIGIVFAPRVLWIEVFFVRCFAVIVLPVAILKVVTVPGYV